MTKKTSHVVTILFLSVLILVWSCNRESSPNSGPTQFSLLESSSSGVTFRNDLEFRKDFNIYTYRNFYNGGGVGIGDINNDGYVDIYFTANMSPNKLYLNNGDLTFEDITDSARVAGTRSWSTGVSMVDINGDGWLDIYVCNSGDIEGDNKQNELFINQGDGTFTERAEDYGLSDQGYSTHAAFFDYDKDGDLDLYLLNNSFQAIGSFNLRKNERPVRNKEGGDKLFRNDNGQFIDVSESAGIYGSVIGFGLGVTVGDIDLDGWQDIYVSNDFFERDYIYMNNGDGTFTENLESQMKSISGASMGADMADINNDGYPEIFVTEMLPEPNERLKTKTTFENWDRYQYNLDNGYYHQFTRNMLHLNNGNESFSEIGRLSGVEATDWSWGALISDFDNDGMKDLFIANGIYQDLTDQDYINYISTDEMAKSVITREGVDFQTLVNVIPSNRIPNYMYRNKGKLKFEDVTEEWGLDAPSHSNGSAYADLDNDGDLDLIINNVNQEASIYINRNEDTNPDHGYLRILLKGPDLNTQAIGAKVSLHQSGQVMFLEQMPIRGFQSSVDPRLLFGLGQAGIDSLVIEWPDLKKSTITDIQTGGDLFIEYDKIKLITKSRFIDRKQPGRFVDDTQILSPIFEHVENDFVDFDRDRLLYHMLSAEGPALCTGDFNGDGITDFFVGGASNQSAMLYMANSQKGFTGLSREVFQKDAISEDVDCACFDADGDGDIDIYVASGGNEFPESSSALIDRLYRNDGYGNFTKSNAILPTFQFVNSSSVAANDLDADGDLDLFVGVRAKPFLIGVPADGYILVNDGSGNFTDQTASVAPGLKQLGLITDAIWSDYDGDNDHDLMVVGEWMGIKLFRNNDGTLEDVSSLSGLDSTNGWWNAIVEEDLDGDGDPDYIVGNHGLNSRFKASKDRPVEIYVNDFDQNGSAESIICTYLGDETYPLALKHDLIRQIPQLQKKYVQYEAYKDQTIEDIFTEDELIAAVRGEVFKLESIVLLNEGEDGFRILDLPLEAQFSPVYAIATDDVDMDGIVDVVLGGNFYYSKPEVGRYDASYGVFLKGRGDGSFEYVPNALCGLFIEDQVRGFSLINHGGNRLLVVAKNDAPMMMIRY